jgi:hypothetical protein
LGLGYFFNCHGCRLSSSIVTSPYTPGGGHDQLQHTKLGQIIGHRLIVF